MSFELEKGVLKSLLVLGSVIEARDAYTGGHAWRVAQYARLIALKAGLSESQAFIAALGGYVHDLGKVAIPDQILHKPSSLDQKETAVMHTHPWVGRGLLEDHPLAALVLEAVFRHHERYDGGGYPEGLPESDLSVYARIVSVADAFDAMTSTRPYRLAMPVEEASTLLAAERDHQFDGDLVDRILSLAREGALGGIVGHSDHDTPLVACPRCGPVIAVPRSAKDGDSAHCRVCQGRFRLHSSGESFEAEFLNERALALVVEPELEHIQGLVGEAPERVKP